MPQAKQHQTNADRQRAYRERKRNEAVAAIPSTPSSVDDNTAWIAPSFDVLADDPMTTPNDIAEVIQHHFGIKGGLYVAGALLKPFFSELPDTMSPEDVTQVQIVRRALERAVASRFQGWPLDAPVQDGMR